MKHVRIVATLLLTAVGSMNVPASAGEPPIPAAEQKPVGAAPESMGPERGQCPGFCRDPRLDGHMMAFRNGMPAPPPPEPPAEFARGPDRALELASRLSTMETLVGIRVAQLDVWREYTAALIDFLDFSNPMPPRPFSGAEAKPSGPDIGEKKPPGLFGEEIADRMLDQAIKARVLKDKAAALRTVLTADQLEKLEDAEQSLDPGPPGFH